MSMKTKGLIVSLISFAITFLSLLLFVEILVRAKPALAESEWIEKLLFTEYAEPLVVYPVNDVWTPPTWYPEQAKDELWNLAALDDPSLDKKGPKLRSRSAFVFDLDRGEVLFEKNADTRWPVASLTKVVSSLALASLGGDLDEKVCLDRTIYASFPGAVTRFNADSCPTGWDLLGAAMVNSDNGGAFGLAHVAKVPHGPFVQQMNSVAADLGMSSSEFVDPAGVNDENLSTARDITRAIIAAAHHPVISAVASAPHWDAAVGKSGTKRRLYSTNRFIHNPYMDFRAAKTGYTYTARNCYTAVVQRNGRTLAVTTLGSFWSKDRWADVKKLLDWSLKQ